VPNFDAADNTLKPQFAKAGVALERDVQPSITFATSTWKIAVVGGYTPEKIALRRAIGWRTTRRRDTHHPPRPGQAREHDPAAVRDRLRPQPAGRPPSTILPPAAERSSTGFGLRRPRQGRLARHARRLAARDQRGTSPSALERQFDELWQRNMNAIGVRIEMVTQKWSDLYKMAKNGQLHSGSSPTPSTSTDGYSFLGMLYGPNAGLSNLARFKLAEFDRLYDTSKKIPPGPSATGSCARCRRWSRHTRRGSSIRIASRTWSSIRG
jgi:hypothetical protein